MENLTFIIRKDGTRELVLESTLFSDHLALFKDVLTERPKDVYGVEVWRAMRGRVKNKTFQPAKNAREFSELLGAPEAAEKEAAEKEAAEKAAAEKAAAEKAAAEKAAAEKAAAEKAAAEKAAAEKAAAPKSKDK